MELRVQIETAWADRALLKEETYAESVREVMEAVDKGRLRVAEPAGDGWKVNEWVKQAILMYFGIQKMETFTLPPFEFYDKMKLKSDNGLVKLLNFLATLDNTFRLFEKFKLL